MKKTFTVIVILLVSLVSGDLEARHIVGGVITYECLGGDDYEFTMKVYRDCNCDNCADLDGRASVAIFRCGFGGTPCSSFEQGDELAVMSVRLDETNAIPNPSDPCLIPPDVCVEEGVYNWKLSDYGLSLPTGNESYRIVYQRCCRNVTIDNLLRPDDQGATFQVEVTPASQRECNSSPVFNTFPPTVICAGEDLVFDHSATDIDGDSIVYEFCAPLDGGGRGGGGDGCNTPAPDPACPPPYDDVTFLLPDYTPSNPIGGDPIVTINPFTGLITGKPQFQGQFVVGVCATEFRNGIAIGRIVRDFQFNVGDCDPLVVGTMDANDIIDGTFILESCTDPVVPINNTSFQERFIDEFFWEFNINGQIVRNNLWDPTIDFGGPGTYYGNLFLNPNTECGDTAYVKVDVYPPIFPDFEFDYDTCVAGEVQFSNLSQVAGADFVETRWQFGDANSSPEPNPSYLYSEPGDFFVNLFLEDENGCTSTISKNVSWFPAPNLIIISPSAEEGCVPFDVFFNNLSSPIDDTYDIEWNFGDSGFGDDISPTHTYLESGIYDVSVKITSPIGCEVDTVFDELIVVEGAPIADFEYTPTALNSFSRTAEFLNKSIRSKYFEWNFDDEYFTVEENPSYTFRDTGFRKASLIAIHPLGCRDTLEVVVDVVPEVTFFLPNAFTPNYDTNNDFYKGVGFVDGMKSFQMRIWNRWGEVIFETDNPEESWNGLKNNVGKPAPDGVYNVVVQYRDPRGQPFELTGFATVIR